MCHRSIVQRVLSVGLDGSGMATSLATLARILAKLLLQPLSFDEHVIWISVAFLPLLAQSSKACPVILLPAVQGFDQLKVDASAGFLDHHLEFLEECGAKEWQPLELVEISEN